MLVKNFGDELDDDKMHKLFEPFGAISSHRVMTDDEGKSKGFGFVSFEEPESAEKVSYLLRPVGIIDIDALVVDVCFRLWRR